MSIRRARSATRYFEAGYPYALSFDGVDDYVSISGISAGVDLTAEIWAKSLEANWNEYGFLFSSRINGGGFVIHPQLDSKVWIAHVLDDSGTVAIGSHAPSSIDDDFHHYAMTYDDSTGEAKMLFDGAVVRSTTLNIARSGATISAAIGRDGSSSRFGHAVETEARIWNVARTQAEIQRDMKRRLSGREPGLVGYWPLWEGSGTTAFDRSGNGNNGSLVNGPTWTTG